MRGICNHGKVGHEQAKSEKKKKIKEKGFFFFFSSENMRDFHSCAFDLGNYYVP